MIICFALVFFFFFIEFERMMQKNFDEEKGDMEEV